MDALEHAHPSEQDRILLHLAHAAIETDTLAQFEYHFIAGYPFAWVSHPGLCGGLIVVSAAHLLFLNHLGFISFHDGNDGQSSTFGLTPNGLARYAELDDFSA